MKLMMIPLAHDASVLKEKGFITIDSSMNPSNPVFRPTEKLLKAPKT